jgi:hypothetical protein
MDSPRRVVHCEWRVGLIRRDDIHAVHPIGVVVDDVLAVSVF